MFFGCFEALRCFFVQTEVLMQQAEIEECSCCRSGLARDDRLLPSGERAADIAVKKAATAEINERGCASGRSDGGGKLASARGSIGRSQAMTP